MAGIVELAFERFRNIRQRQRINEKLDDAEQDIQDAGLSYLKFRLVDWHDAQFQPKDKPVLFTRIRGSPKSLETDGMFLATYTQVRTNIERFGISDDLKTAIAAIAAENAVPESKTADSILPKLEERQKELKKIRQSVSRDKLSVPTVLRLASRVDAASPVPKSTVDFIRALEDYEKIAEKAIQKEEFLKVLKAWGDVDLNSLSGMYSVIMALVLKYPGRTLSDYHKMRLAHTNVERESAATWEELTSLIEFGYVTTDRGRKRYWPDTNLIKKRYKVTPPKVITLKDWMR